MKPILFILKHKYISILTIILLLLLSWFLGILNLTLMTTTSYDLKRYHKSSSFNEQKCASKLLFLQKRRNFLVVSLLICGILVNYSITVILTQLLENTLTSIFLSFFLITFYCSIMPHFANSKYTLRLVGRTTWIIIFLSIIVSPLSFPLGKIMDYFNGKSNFESKNVEDLGLLEPMIDRDDASFVEKNEKNTINEASDSLTKKVKDVMRTFEEIFMISEDVILDFETMNDIKSHGYSRVPVYADDDRKNICGLLNVKDLSLINPNDRIPLKAFCQSYQRHVISVDAETCLDSMLNEFCQRKAEMAFVETLTPGNTRHIIGLVTLKDVINNILQTGIHDQQSDAYDEEQQKYVYSKKNLLLHRLIKKNVGMSMEMKLAVYEHLSTNVFVFGTQFIQREALKSLLNEDDNIVRYVREPGTEAVKLYEEGKQANFAVLILEGQVRVILIREQLVCVGSPFMFFGESMLIEVNKAAEASPLEIVKVAEMLPPNLPDYTVEPVGNLVYFRITRRQYAKARQASILNRTTNTDIGRGQNAT